MWVGTRQAGAFLLCQPGRLTYAEAPVLKFHSAVRQSCGVAMGAAHLDEVAHTQQRRVPLPTSLLYGRVDRALPFGLAQGRLRTITSERSILKIREHHNPSNNPRSAVRQNPTDGDIVCATGPFPPDPNCCRKTGNSPAPSFFTRTPAKSRLPGISPSLIRRSARSSD